MNIKNRIMEFIEDHGGTTPLEFLTYSGKSIGGEKITELKNLSLDDLIYEILDLSAHYCSYSDNEISCTYNKWRSSGDIWRHVKFFKPEITIFEVMESLYRISSNLHGHWCFVIEKRVFKTREHSPSFTLSVSDRDEYNLRFSDWKNISQEN